MRRFSFLTLYWLFRAWRRWPHVRLGQLIDDALWSSGGSVWGAENDELRRALRAAALMPRRPARPSPRKPPNVRGGLALVRGGRR